MSPSSSSCAAFRLAAHEAYDECVLFISSAGSVAVANLIYALFCQHIYEIQGRKNRTKYWNSYLWRSLCDCTFSTSPVPPIPETNSHLMRIEHGTCLSIDMLFERKLVSVALFAAKLNE